MVQEISQTRHPKLLVNLPPLRENHPRLVRQPELDDLREVPQEMMAMVVMKIQVNGEWLLKWETVRMMSASFHQKLIYHPSQQIHHCAMSFGHIYLHT